MKILTFKKILLVAMSAVMLGHVSAQEVQKAPLKVGFVYVGPVGDFGWTYQHDQGRQAIEKAFGDKVATTYVESVKEGPDAERVINQLANDGNSLIFTTSFGFMNPTLKSAKRFPKIKFEHATGYKRADNVATYSSRFYEGRYIAGVLGGKMTKSNTIGYVASYPIPEVIRGINATMLGAQSVNPKAKIKVVWVSSWYDPAKETEAAKSLLSAGADVIMQHTDSPAVPQIGEENGVWVVGSATDMSKFAPTKQLTAIIDDWKSYYVNRVAKALENKWQSMDTWGGFKLKMVDLAPFNQSIPAETRDSAQKLREAITAGTFHPFTGPIVDRDGKEIAKAGEVISDDQLLKMNFFVKGVEGELPK
ncbi:MAG: BMP family ABC transporter substrate-binding protein [Gammaproteobacteria bacterium]|nr:MAG: BMP family ABC transporter substrate-binding protein [Gammaproteobacteria bacterium]